MGVTSFRELSVWKESMQLVYCVYRLIEKFPAKEQFALCDQLRRAVVSIPSNIAEGFGRDTHKEFAHFLTVGRGSLYEVLTQIRIAQHLGYVSEVPELESLSLEVANMLGAMLKKYGSLQSQE